MTVHGHDVAADARRLIAEGYISEHALQAVTKVAPERVSAFLATSGSAGLSSDQPPLSPDESARVSILVGHLTVAFDIADDERLRAMLEGLTGECGFTLQNISRLTHVPVDEVTTALHDPGTLAAETKYALALRVSYLINAANQARAR
ncbi:HTH domain-containing protein [Microbacterium sp. CIAB417]|uniref:HTH domain-containing protein n=1 Tax=Microbacterium sp. CIAB417 TaxID=2860287 RepID=UPI001FAE4C17|nr:HTH domain-containing protein [Microbacterium sp. CIAB417]